MRTIFYIAALCLCLTGHLGLGILVFAVAYFLISKDS